MYEKIKRDKNRLPPDPDRRNSLPPPAVFIPERAASGSVGARSSGFSAYEGGVPPGRPGIRTASHPAAPSGPVPSPRGVGPAPGRQGVASSPPPVRIPGAWGVAGARNRSAAARRRARGSVVPGPEGGGPRPVDGRPCARSLSRGRRRTSKFRAGRISFLTRASWDGLKWMHHRMPVVLSREPRWCGWPCGAANGSGRCNSWRCRYWKNTRHQPSCCGMSGGRT